MSKNNRNKELAMIHIAAEQLGMDTHDDDPTSDYRSMLWTVARVDSAGKLDAAGRDKVLKHLKALGFKAQRTRKADPDRPHNLDSNPQLKKIEAFLAEARRPWKYVRGMAKGMYKKDALEFCTPAELNGLIAALWKDQQRRRQRAAT